MLSASRAHVPLEKLPALCEIDTMASLDSHAVKVLRDLELLHPPLSDASTNSESKQQSQIRRVTFSGRSFGSTVSRVRLRDKVLTITTFFSLSLEACRAHPTITADGDPP